jgi:hypothetical protein
MCGSQDDAQERLAPIIARVANSAEAVRRELGK